MTMKMGKTLEIGSKVEECERQQIKASSEYLLNQRKSRVEKNLRLHMKKDKRKKTISNEMEIKKVNTITTQHSMNEKILATNQEEWANKK